MGGGSDALAEQLHGSTDRLLAEICLQTILRLEELGPRRGMDQTRLSVA